MRNFPSEAAALDAMPEPEPAASFTGNVARMQLGKFDNDRLLQVRFEKGARTHWHSHAGAQMLYVLEGTCWLATETDRRALAVGEMAYIPAGVLHWHGASTGGPMTHVAANLNEIRDTDWREAVTEDDYQE